MPSSHTQISNSYRTCRPSSWSWFLSKQKPVMKFLQPHVKPHCWSIGIIKAMPGPSIRSSQIISICTSWNFLEVKANQNTMHALPKVTMIQFCHPSRQTTHARQLCVIIVPSEALNEWSPHHLHPCWQISTKMLTSVSLISDPIHQKSCGCGLQNCHPFLGVATTKLLLLSDQTIYEKSRLHVSVLY